MNKSTETQNRTQSDETIDTIEAVELDNVTGGCAACGMANCTMGANPAASGGRASLFSGLFNRR